MNQNGADKVNNAEGISVPDLVKTIKSGGRYIKSKRVPILIFVIVGALLGLGYFFKKKPTYTAACTFVLEDSKSGGLGQYAGLASLAGITMGSGSGTDGIFQGDNILELYKSRTMIESTLLSACTIDGKKELLIDRYINFTKLRERWQPNSKLNGINFNGNPDGFNRNQDSIITDLVELFNRDVLNVSKPDKKLSIISVEVTSKDELFSKCFAEKLVNNVNDFYVHTKTKKAYGDVQILQHQADSVKTILNSSINGVASAIDADPNANPLMSALRTTSQKKQVDVQANSAIYGEIVKNLELAKISFRQEMPLIQVIDKPVLPLKKNQTGIVKAIFLGGFILGFIAILFFIIKRVFQKILAIA